MKSTGSSINWMVFVSAWRRFRIGWLWIGWRSVSVRSMAFLRTHMCRDSMSWGVLNFPWRGLVMSLLGQFLGHRSSPPSGSGSSWGPFLPGKRRSQTIFGGLLLLGRISRWCRWFCFYWCRRWCCSWHCSRRFWWGGCWCRADSSGRWGCRLGQSRFQWSCHRFHTFFQGCTQTLFQGL